MGLIFAVLMFVLGIFQLAAFQAGLQSQLGLPWLLSIIVGVVALSLGPIGGLAVAVVGFLGAMHVWHWPWYQAGLLCFPSIILAVVSLVVGGTVSISDRLFNRDA